MPLHRENRPGIDCDPGFRRYMTGRMAPIDGSTQPAIVPVGHPPTFERAAFVASGQGDLLDLQVTIAEGVGSLQVPVTRYVLCFDDENSAFQGFSTDRLGTFPMEGLPPSDPLVLTGDGLTISFAVAPIIHPVASFPDELECDDRSSKDPRRRVLGWAFEDGFWVCISTSQFLAFPSEVGEIHVKATYRTNPR